VRLRGRFQFQAPQWNSILHEDGITWKTCWSGHGSDEYGNCSVYFTSALLGGIVFFWDPHFQLKVQVPNPNEATPEQWQSWYEAKYN
jgi:hypothetical protein